MACKIGFKRQFIVNQAVAVKDSDTYLRVRFPNQIQWGPVLLSKEIWTMRLMPEGVNPKVYA